MQNPCPIKINSLGGGRVGRWSNKKLEKNCSKNLTYPTWILYYLTIWQAKETWCKHEIACSYHAYLANWTIISFKNHWKKCCSSYLTYYKSVASHEQQLNYGPLLSWLACKHVMPPISHGQEQKVPWKPKGGGVEQTGMGTMNFSIMDIKQTAKNIKNHIE